MKPSEWCDMEKGLATMEMIARAKAAVEAETHEPSQG